MSLMLRGLLALALWAMVAALGWWWRLPNTSATPNKNAIETIMSQPAPAAPATGAAAMAKRIMAVDPLTLSRPAPSPLEAKPAAASALAEGQSWRLAALGVRGKDGFAVLTSAGQTPLRLVVGNLLPDGDRIKAIHADRIVLISPRGRARTLYLIEP
jgi:hypothetical protein